MRWILTGVRTPSGLVRLEAARAGGRWFSSLEAVERFITAQTPDLNNQAQAAPRSPSARQRAADRAARELEQLGI
jgi:hypothetical protein